MKAKNLIGIMQGRLLTPINNRIQAFPVERWHEEFLIAKELGLDCIEFIFEGEDFRKHPLMRKEGIDTIKKTETETGVRVLSVCADYFMDFPLHKGDQIGKNISVLKELISNSSLLGVRDIIIPCVDHSRISNPEEMTQFESSLNRCIPLAEKYSINITLEADLPPEDFLSLLNRFKSHCIKVNYDMGNSAFLGYNPGKEIDAYGRWITDVHIKDRVYKGGTVPLGNGNVDFQVVFNKLREMNFSGIYIFQSARKETGREKETIKEYMKFIEQYLN